MAWLKAGSVCIPTPSSGGRREPSLVHLTGLGTPSDSRGGGSAAAASHATQPDASKYSTESRYGRVVETWTRTSSFSVCPTPSDTAWV